MLSNESRFTSHRWVFFVCSGVASLCLQGCLHRRVTIDSDPPGAQVLLDGEDQGITPLAFDIDYYGTREITLVKDGFETRTIMQKIRTPWYQIFPLDFITDNFLPFRMTNRHSFLYRMQPQVHVPEKDLLNRANSLRSESHIGR